MKAIRKVLFLLFTAMSLFSLSIQFPTSANAGSGTWEVFQSLANFNPGTMVLLTDGSVLFADHGADQTGSSNYWILKPDNKGNYSTGTWSKTGSLQSGYAPDNKGGGLIADGRVVVVGGDRNGANVFVGINQGSIYDPLSKTWSVLNPPNDGKGQFTTIADAPSLILANGQFMFGPSGNGDHGAQNQKQIAILNAASLTWTFGGTGRTGANPEAGFVLLPNGKVLTISTAVPSGSDTEIFDPATMTWASAGKTPASLVDPATAKGGPIGEIGPSILMPNGKIFAEGSTKFTAVFDTQTGQWSAGPDMPMVGGVQYVADDAPSVIMPNGNVLFSASPIGDGLPPTHFFTFDGSKITQISDPPASTSVARVPAFSGFFMPLPNGQILFNNRMGPTGLALYNPDNSADPAWLPKITSVPTELSVGSTYSVTGKQLSGLTAGAAFGDDWGTTSNYSVIQITNIATGKVTYAPTKMIGSFSVSPNFESTTTFALSTDAVNGPSQLRVISGLYASDPTTVNVSLGQPAPVVASTPTPTPTPTATPTPTSSPSASPSPSPSQTPTTSAALAKKTTVTCVKGKVSKKVTAVNPQCPSGYKKK